MIAMLFSPIGKAAGALMVGIIIASTIFLFAYRMGRETERAAMLERSVEILRERNLTDDQIRNMDDAELCRALGGVWVSDTGACQ